MNEDRVVRLKAEIEAYPYDSDARISVAEALLANSTDKELVNQQLMEDALFMPSRVVLYFLMHGAEEKVSAQLNSVAHGSEAQSGKQSAERSGAQDRTVSLIDSYLAENPAEKPRRKLTLADASTDYASWLEQNDKDEAGENTIQSVETDVTVNVDDPAEILIRNGEYAKAIEIMQRQIADNPEKSCYFADRIRFLNKVIQLKRE